MELDLRSQISELRRGTVRLEAEARREAEGVQALKRKNGELAAIVEGKQDNPELAHWKDRARTAEANLRLRGER